MLSYLIELEKLDSIGIIKNSLHIDLPQQSLYKNSPPFFHDIKN